MSPERPALTDPFRIGDVEIANRVMLAPLAGIGNWFVRLQARRHGAGLAVSEMVSSFALHHGNERTLREMLVVHPDEHPVSIQLFGHDPEKMETGARMAAEAGADIIDINMGCPVRKVRKTGAGVSLLETPELAIELARAARAGSNRPVTVKLRSGVSPGDTRGLDVAVQLVEEAGVAAIAFHPRSAAVHHAGSPDYALVRRLTELIEVPVIVSGGLSSVDAAQRAFEESGADAVMVARGFFGDPWLVSGLLGDEDHPSREEIAAELIWLLDRAEEHFGSARAARFVRKFYPWYLPRLGLSKRETAVFQQLDDLDRARRMIAGRHELVAG